MKKRIALMFCSVVATTTIIFFCSPSSNPFTDSRNAKISLAFKDSHGLAGTDLAVSDTVGNTVKIGICTYLSNLIDSVMVTIVQYRNNTDSVFVLKNFSSDIDTVWNSFTFTAVGKWTVNAVAIVQGGRQYAISGAITIHPKTVSATIQPAAETRVEDSIAVFTVHTTADTPLTCQWYHDTSAMIGETGASFVKSHITLSDSGKYGCLVRDKWGDTGTAQPAILTVTRKIGITTNAKPTLHINGYSNILSFETCSLTVTATEPDSGQKDSIVVVTAPQGYLLADSLFTWLPHLGYLGADSMRVDSAIFVAIDNGKPPMSDTQKVYIIVTSKILQPDSVRGLTPVSRLNGVFTFNWNKSANADLYLIFRSKDTTGFVQIGTAHDTTFTNNIKDTAFYYYVVATNSKSSSSPSVRIRSTSINTAPQWSHNAINLSINEGIAFSLDLADSVHDVNGDAVTLLFSDAGSVNDSIVGTKWKYAPSYSDSGVKTIKIKATDGIDSSVLTMSVHVINVPRPPQPQPQNLSTSRNTALNITLTALIPDGDAVTTWTIDTTAKHGIATLAGASSPGVTYTPAGGFIGTDYFTFKAAVGSLSSTYSAKISIKVDTGSVAPKLATKLTNKTLTKGDSLILSVTINSDAFPAPTYYWFKNAAPAIDSSMTGTWRKLQLALSDSGYYYVIVKNSAGKDSSGAKVTMQCAPVISSKLNATTMVYAGSATAMSVTVNTDVTPAPTYKWYVNGNAIQGDTTNNCSKTWAVADTGRYTVIVSNAAGTDSSFTKLSVKLAPSNLTYSSNPAIYWKGIQITANTATVSGTVDSFTVSPALPAGLTLDKSAGTIGGTPTAATAATNYTVTARNPAGATTATLSITVNGAPTSLSYATSPAIYWTGVAITANTATVTGSVDSFTVTPALPAGLSLNKTSGTISGTPTAAAAAANYTVTAKNVAGTTTATVNITVNGAPSNLTYATTPATYWATVAITPNTATISGSVDSFTVSPALPAGLSISKTNGTISGTPTAATAAANYTVTARNPAGTTTATVNITVNGAPSGFSYTTSPATYWTSVQIAQNTPIISGSVDSFTVAPALPAGLAIIKTSGVIWGTPTAAATGTYTVTAWNKAGNTTAIVSITVKGQPTNLTYLSTTATYWTNLAITPNTATTGGGPVDSFTVSPTLPAGLSISKSNGTISGTPTAATAQATYTVTARNPAGTATATLTITVSGAPAAPTLSSPANGVGGIPLSTTLSWGATTNAVTYYVQVSSASDFSTGMVLNDSTQAPTVSKAVTLPQNGVQYYWRVSARDQGGLGNWSTASFYTIKKFTLTVTQATGGTITPSTGQYDSGATVQLTATATAGYQFASWTGDFSGVSANPGSITMNSAKVGSASFSAITFNITSSAGSNGTISPSGTTPVTYNGSQPYTITPGTGYHIASITVDLSGVTVTNSASMTYTFSNVTAAHAISVTFAINTYQLIVVSSPGGTISAPTVSPLIVNYGVAATISASPQWYGYTFLNWSITTGSANIANANNASTTVTLTSTDATLKANFITVGMSYGGGIIFYIDATGQHGLIAATADLARSNWGCDATTLIGTNPGLGTGKGNTISIVNACNDPTIAAALCKNLSLGGFTDWYLPSQEEVDTLFDHKDQVTNMTDGGYYWSSTEYNAANAMADGGYGSSQAWRGLLKTAGALVRPIRSF